MYGSFSEQSLQQVKSMFDFARCVRPDGSAYGTGGKCRKGVEQEKQDKGIRIGKTVRQLPVGDLQKLIKNPRLKPHQVKTLEALIQSKSQKPKSAAERMAAAAEKLEKQQPSAPKTTPKPRPKTEKVEEAKAQEGRTAAAKVARPVNPKVAAKVDKAVKAKQAGPGYTPEQLAAQDKLLAESQTKGKKPKETPEEKAEKKWLAQEEKVKAIQAEHDKIKEELKAQGVQVFATGKGADILHRKLKEKGLPSQMQLSRMQLKLRESEPERLKRERIEREKERIAAEIAGTSREKRKEMILAEIERIKGRGYLKTLKEVNDNVDMIQKWIDEDPSMATLKNRVALTAMRALRAQMVREARSDREAKNKSLDVSLREAPKYDSTPGSRKPADAKQLLGDYQEFLKKEKELDARREKMENTPPFNAKWSEDYRNLLDEISAHSKRRRIGLPVTLDEIYEVQGFNAKPELVRSRADLESRTDILREPDGRPLILYRGVTEEGYARQFQGSGPDGDKHFPGKGVYGNGTYAASAGANVKESSWITDGNYDQTAQRTAISYASGGQGAGDRVTAFALRRDANVVQFEGETTSERDRRYYEWRTEITRQAKERFGVDFYDHGEAAAAMGIHAYRVPMSDSEDYWVILNRGAVIAAQDPQLPEQ